MRARLWLRVALLGFVAGYWTCAQVDLLVEGRLLLEQAEQELARAAAEDEA